KAHFVACQPAPMVRQKADVAKMIAEVGANGAQDLEVRHMRGASNAAEVLLMQQIANDFTVKLSVEPVDEPPHFGPLLAVAWKQRHRTPIDRVLGIFLCQVLGNSVGTADEHAIAELEHRQLAGGIEGQELLPPLPRLF